MISRIASRVAFRFLKLVRTASVKLKPHGTAQIGNRAAEYEIKDLEGGLKNCRFRIWMRVLGKQFLLSGSVKSDRVSLSQLIDLERHVQPDAHSMHQTFGVDPELWVKRILADAIVRSIGSEPKNLSDWVVVNGEVIDSSVLKEEHPSALPKAV